MINRESTSILYQRNVTLICNLGTGRSSSVGILEGNIEVFGEKKQLLKD